MLEKGVSAVTVNGSAHVNLVPQAASGGSWSWTGPGGFTSASQVLQRIPLPGTTNAYTVTYTNSSGATSTRTFVVTVE